MDYTVCRKMVHAEETQGIFDKKNYNLGTLKPLQRKPLLDVLLMRFFKILSSVCNVYYPMQKNRYYISVMAITEKSRKHKEFDTALSVAAGIGSFDVAVTCAALVSETICFSSTEANKQKQDDFCKTHPGCSEL